MNNNLIFFWKGKMSMSACTWLYKIQIIQKDLKRKLLFALSSLPLPVIWIKKKLTSYVTSDKSSNSSKHSFLICYGIVVKHGLPWWLRQYRICLQCRRPWLDPWVRKIPWRREWLPTPVFLPGESQGQRSLVGRWDHKESDKNLAYSIIIFPWAWIKWDDVKSPKS